MVVELVVSLYNHLSELYNHYLKKHNNKDVTFKTPKPPINLIIMETLLCQKVTMNPLIQTIVSGKK